MTEHPDQVDDANKKDNYLERALALAFSSQQGNDARATSELKAPERAGRFRILSEIARGGGGVVYRAHDPELNRNVAIKVLQGGPRGASEARDRFRREVLVSGQLQHPAFVPVHEGGELETGEPFYVMRLVEGATLADLLQQRAELDDDRASNRSFLTILEQVAQALGFAHARGIVHRDLKPSNIMVGAFGEVQVMDWGLAKILGEAHPAVKVDADSIEPAETPEPGTRPASGSSHSIAGSVMGTPWYMPPEQARGEIERVDQRADVFALGAMLCQILTGKPPFPGEREAALQSARTADLGLAFTSLDNCGAGAELIALAKRSLAENVDERPRDAKQFADALTGYFTEQEEHARTTELATETGRVEAREQRRRRRLRLALVGAILIAVAAAGFGHLARERDARERIETLSRKVQDVNDAALDALVRAEAAASKDFDDVAAWDAALRKIEQAEGLLASGDVHAGLPERVLDLRERADLGHERALAFERDRERDRQMLERLANVRASHSSGTFAKAHADYTGAFASYGIDLNTPVPTEMRQRDIAPGLARAMAQWVLIVATYSQEEHAKQVDFIQDLLDRASELDPHPQRSAIRKALHDGKTAKLEELAVESATARFEVETFALLAGALRLQVVYESSAEVYRRGLMVHPGDCLLASEYLGLLSTMGDVDEAVRVARTSLGACDGSRQARHVLGNLLEKRGDNQAALEQFEALMEMDPDDSHTLVHAARNLRRLGRADDALGYARHATTVEPEDHSAWLETFYVEHGRNRRRAMVATARKAYEFGQESHSAQRALADSLYYTGQYEEARRVYEHGLSRDTKRLAKRYWVNEANHWMKYGAVLSMFGEIDLAIEAQHIAMRYNPARVEAHCNIAHALVRAGRFQEAIDEYRLCHEQGSVQPSWRYPADAWLADAEQDLERVARFEELEVAAAQTATLEFASDEEACAFVLALSNTAHHDLAVRVFEEVLARNPKMAIREADVYAAGSAAALVGAQHLDADERLSYGERAIDWLHADLESWLRDVQSDTDANLVNTVNALSQRTLDRRFANLRDKSQLDALRTLGPRGAALAQRAADFWADVKAELEALAQLETEQEAR